MHPLEKKVADYILANHLVTKDKTIVVAISGGKDSVALALILKKLGYSIVLAHVNFMLRDRASDDDECFVKNFAQELECPFFNIKYNTNLLKKPKESIQLAARRIRYDWFKHLLTEYPEFKVVATAHSANDSAETILYNLTKGTGLAGLVGIPKKNQQIIRPLLSCETSEIINYLSTVNQANIEDQSNLSTYYSRNKIRHKVLPILEGINPSFVSTLSQHQLRFQRIHDFYRDQVSVLKKRYWIWHKDGYWCINRKDFKCYDHYLNLWLEWMLPLGFSESALHDILEAQTGAVISSEHYQLAVHRDYLLFSQNSSATCMDCEIFLDKKGQFDTELGILRWQQIEFNDISALKNPDFAYLDSEKIGDTLALRRPKDGEKFQPMGLNGSQKISKYAINQGLNIFQKNQLLVLASHKGMHWLVGHRIDKKCCIIPSSRIIYEFQWLKKIKKPFDFI